MHSFSFLTASLRLVIWLHCMFRFFILCIGAFTSLQSWSYAAAFSECDHSSFEISLQLSISRLIITSHLSFISSKASNTSLLAWKESEQASTASSANLDATSCWFLQLKEWLLIKKRRCTVCFAMTNASNQWLCCFNNWIACRAEVT